MAIAKKIGCVLIVCLLTALCAVQAFADDVFANYETISLTSPFWWYGFYTSDGGALAVSGSRNSNSVSVLLPGSESVGLPLLKTSYSMRVSDPTFWSVDYSYVFSFDFVIAFNSGIVGESGTVPSGQSFSTNSFGLSQGTYWWNTSQNFNKRLLSDISSYFDFRYSSEPFTHNSTYVGRIQHYTIVFKMDQLPNDLFSLAYLTSFSEFNIPSRQNYIFFGNWGMTALYDPEGNITVDSSDVDDIVQGQLDAVDYGLQQELDQTNQAASDASDDGQAEAASTFNFSSYSDSLTGLISALGYTGTDFHFNFPAAGNIPYVGDLWSQQEIPLKQFIDSLPPGLLYVLRFLAWLALLFSVVHTIRKLISDLNGGDE